MSVGGSVWQWVVFLAVFSVSSAFFTLAFEIIGRRMRRLRNERRLREKVLGGREVSGSGKVFVGVPVAGRAEALGGGRPETLGGLLLEPLVLLLKLGRARLEIRVLRLKCLVLRLKCFVLGLKSHVLLLKCFVLRLKSRKLRSQMRDLSVRVDEALAENRRQRDFADDVHEPAHGPEPTRGGGAAATPEARR